MGTLAEELKDQLECKAVFSFNIPRLGTIDINESIVVTWIIMAALTVIAILLTRNLKVKNPGKRQVALEFVVTKLQSMAEDMLGEGAAQYAQYIVTVLIYLAVANLIGLCGFKPPTKDLNVTAALAIMSIILIEAAGIRTKGVKRWAKSFAEPIAIVAPLNVLEIVIRPLSLCMRLFGNVLGAFVIMEIIKHLCGLILPIPFSLYFDVFDGLIQAYVFVFLTSLFIREATE